MVDLYGGAEDLKNGIIRCVGDPMKRFDDDGLRILRALRGVWKSESFPADPLRPETTPGP